MGGDPGQGARPAARDRRAGCRRGGAVNENHEPDRTGPVAWVNGRLMPADAPALPVADRGFQLGDGVFETLRVRRGVAIELDLHLRRLREGLAAVSYTHLRAHETRHDLVCRLLLEKKKQ